MTKCLNRKKQMSTQENPARVNLSVVARIKNRMLCCISRDITIYADSSNAPAVIQAVGAILPQESAQNVEIPEEPPDPGV